MAFAIDGSATMQAAPGVRLVAEQALAGGASRLVVDLHQCTYIDSTFMGTLLRLRRLAEEQPGGQFLLCAPSPQCLQVLKHLCLDRLFHIESACEAPSSHWVELDTSDTDLCSRDFKQKLVDAHCELARAPGPAGQRFAPLAERMAKELEAEAETRVFERSPLEDTHNGGANREPAAHDEAPG